MLERFGARLDKVTKKVITETQTAYKKLRKEITEGRDRLLELSSFRPDIGKEVAEQIREEEQSGELQDYLFPLFEHYGVRVEPLDETSFHISPDQLFDDLFPLPAEGIRITFNRDDALIRPENILMTWDHPMVTGASEVILGSERGSCAIAVDPTQDVPLKLQAIYVLETVAPPALNADRFLPPTPVSIVVDHTGSEMDDTVEAQLKDVNRGDCWNMKASARR